MVLEIARLTARAEAAERDVERLRRENEGLRSALQASTSVLDDFTRIKIPAGGIAP
jgi:hypothetical protein